MFIILLVIFQLLYIFIYFIFRKKSRFIKILIYVILALNIVFFLLSKNTVNYLYYLKYTFFSINLSIFIYILSTFINQNKKDKLFKNINIFIDKYGIYIFLVSFFIVLTFLTFLRHLNFFTAGFDLGIFSQVIWKMGFLETPSSSIRMIGNILGDHFQPILYFYAIFYKIIPNPLVLIFLQNLFFVFGAFGIYKISNLKLKIPVIGLVFVFLYVFFIGNINALFFDFHPDVLAFSLFPWLFYLSIKKKWIYFYLLVFFILFSKENLSIYIFFFGVYQIISTKNRLVGLSLVFIGGLYFYLAMNYFIPYMGGSSSTYWSYNLIGNNPKELIINSIKDPLKVWNVLFLNDEKITTYLHYLSSGLYFAISPISILLIPSFAQKFLSTREGFWGLDYHYSIDTYGTLLVSIIFFLFYLKKKFKNNYPNLFMIIVVFIFINFSTINFSKNKLFNIGFLENKQYLLEALDIIGENDSVSAQNMIVPHLSNKNNVYVFPIIRDSKYIILNKNAFDNQLWPFKNKYYFYDFLEKIEGKQSLDLVIEEPFFRNRVKENSGKYDLVYNKNGVLLFKRVDNEIK